MGTNPGGSYDLYGRVIAEHLSRHIPGNPTIIMEHMPGAGGVIAGNHIYGPGPQDGTKILLSHSIPLAEKLEPKGVRFESAKFHWLGTFDAIAHTMAIWHEAQVNTIDDLKTKPLTIGSFAKAHLTYQWPAMMKYVLGTNFKVITGYRSGSDCNLAMERGEIQGWAASWENLAGTRPQWLAEKKVSVLLSFTLERKKQIPDVPTLLELARPTRGTWWNSSPPARRSGAPWPWDRACRRPRRSAAQGVRRRHEGSGLPRRRQEAQARHRPAPAAYAHALAQQAHLRLARAGGAGEEGDRAGGVAALRHRRVRCSLVSGR